MVVVLAFEQWQFAGLSAQSILTRVLILGAGFLGGAPLGAAMGVVIGLVPSLSTTGLMSTATMGYYGLMGLLAGLLYQRGKVQYSIGFVIANVLLIPFYYSEVQMIFALLESSVALVIFFFLPIQKQPLMTVAPVCRKEVDRKSVV